MLGPQSCGLLEMFKRRLRSFLLEKEDSQIQPCFKEIGREFQRFLVSLDRLRILVKPRVSVAQVELRRGRIRLRCHDGFERLHGFGKVVAIESLLGGLQERTHLRWLRRRRRLARLRAKRQSRSQQQDHKYGVDESAGKLQCEDREREAQVDSRFRGNDCGGRGRGRLALGRVTPA